MMCLLTFSVAAQKESGDVRSGNRLYKASKFTEAEIAYRKGLLKNKASFEANYNLGNALFRQKKYAEAVEQYNNALALQPKEKTKIAAALHNTGNSLLVDNKIEERSVFKIINSSLGSDAFNIFIPFKGIIQEFYEHHGTIDEYNKELIETNIN